MPELKELLLSKQRGNRCEHWLKHKEPQPEATIQWRPMSTATFIMDDIDSGSLITTTATDTMKVVGTVDPAK